MAKSVFIGINSLAKKVKKLYFGVGSKAKIVKKGYFGIGGKAKQFYSKGVQGGLYCVNPASGDPMEPYNVFYRVDPNTLGIISTLTIPDEWRQYDRKSIELRGGSDSNLLCFHPGFKSNFFTETFYAFVDPLTLGILRKFTYADHKHLYSGTTKSSIANAYGGNANYFFNYTVKSDSSVAVDARGYYVNKLNKDELNVIGEVKYFPYNDRRSRVYVRTGGTPTTSFVYSWGDVDDYDYFGFSEHNVDTGAMNREFYIFTGWNQSPATYWDYLNGYLYVCARTDEVRNSRSISFKKRDYSSLADIAIVGAPFGNGWTGALVAVK